MKLHRPIPDSDIEPGHHDSERVVPQPPVPPEMEPELPEPEPEKTPQPKDVPGAALSGRW
jgi:hypothetical protein